MLAARTRERAGHAPAEAEIRNLAAEAVARGGKASADEVRAILDQAIGRQRQIGALLRRLGELLPPQEAR